MLRLAAEFKLDTIHIEGTELLDSLVTSVFLLDQDLHVDYLNAAAQTLLGLCPNQALGRSITELTRGAESLLPMFDRARQGGEGIVQRELAWPASGGVDRILDCAVTQATLGQDNSRLLLEIEDITQHRRLTRENALLAQLGGSRLMVRQLAHEIKNPLGGLRGAAQLLERELLDPALREYTRVIISEADRLTNLLDSMLGPGRPPAKQLINVHEILERVYHLLRSEAPEGVTVDRDYDPSLPPLTLDPNHISHLPAHGFRMNAKPLQVWLVDDDASIRWVLEKALKGSGMAAKCFDQADYVLTALRSDAPDVLMTDIRMPGRSGLDLLKEIQVSRPGLPVIVMTTHSDLDAPVRPYQGGAF